MELNFAANLKCPWRNCAVVVLAVLGVAVSSHASTGEVRHVEVQGTLGQMYDATIAADDAETFGLGIPRGTALPRRMYPVRNLGTPMIQRLQQPLYKDVLLRHIQRNHTEYLDPNCDGDLQASPSSPALSVAPGAASTNGAISLSWPVSAGHWTLECAPALAGSATVWLPVSPSSYQTNGSLVSFTETAQTSRARFFRLRQP